MSIDQNYTSHWLPTPYLCEGLALGMTTLLPAVMYRQLGMNNGEITMFLGLMYLPWVIRPLWHERAKSLGGRHWWALVLQMVIIFSFGLLAFAMQTKAWLTASMLLLWVAAFASAAYGDHNETLFALTTPPNRYYHYNKLRAATYGVAFALVMGVMIMVVGNLQVLFRGSIRYSWSLTLYGAVGLFILLWLWHLHALPRVARPDNTPWRQHPVSPLHVLRVFMAQPHSRVVALFLLLYPIPAGLLNRSTELFLIDNAGNGGMALSPQEFGLSWGTVGSASLIVGLVAGAAVVRRWGLRLSILPMAAAMAVPSACLLWLSQALPYSLTTTSLAIMLLQLSLGFAIMPLLHVAGHYARPDSLTATPNMICVSIAAMGMMAGSMTGGSLQDAMGYADFYTLATTAAILPLAAAIAMTVGATKLKCFSHGKKQTAELGEKDEIG